MKYLAGLGVVLAASCGKVHDDAAVPDAFVPDANLMGTASVVTRSHVAGAGMIGDLAANIAVFSLRPDGTMLDMQTTDGNGAGSLMIYGGGSVTAVYPHLLDNGGAAGSMQGADLVTFGGVSAGDALAFGTRFTQPAGASVGSVTVSFPNEGPFGASDNLLYTPCGVRSVGSFPVSVPVYAWCATSPWEVSSYQVSIFGAAAYFGVASATLTNNSGSISGTYGASHVVAASVTGLPAETKAVRFNLAGTINPAVFGTNVAQSFQNTATLGTGDAAGTATSNITAFVDGDHYQGQVTLSRNTNFGATSLYQVVATDATTWSIAATGLPPWLNGHQYFSAEGKAAWAIDKTDGAATFDGIVVALAWTHTTVVNGSNIVVPSTWTFILPPTATSVTLPSLPAPLAGLAPMPDKDTVSATISLVEFPSVDGYDALRGVPEGDIVCPDCAVRAGTMTSAMVNR